MCCDCADISQLYKEAVAVLAHVRPILYGTSDLTMCEIAVLWY